MRRSHLILLVVFNVFWAGILSANLELSHHLTYTSIVTLRFAISALGFLLLWPWLPGPSPRGWALLRVAIMGVVVFCLGQRLQVLGNTLGTAGNSSVLMGFEPILTSVAAAVFLRESVPLNRWVGFALCLAGLALLNRVWSPDFHWTGLGASLIFVSSFLCESVYSIMGKPLGSQASPYKVVAISLAAGTILNLGIDGHRSLTEASHLPLYGWGLLLYMSVVCTMTGYVLWLLIIAETPVNLVAMTIFVQPVAGVVIARVFLNESPHWGQIWGAFAIGAGLMLGFLKGTEGSGALSSQPEPSAQISKQKHLEG